MHAQRHFAEQDEKFLVFIISRPLCVERNGDLRRGLPEQPPCEVALPQLVRSCTGIDCIVVDAFGSARDCPEKHLVGCRPQMQFLGEGHDLWHGRQSIAQPQGTEETNGLFMAQQRQRLGAFRAAKAAVSHAEDALEKGEEEWQKKNRTIAKTAVSMCRHGKCKNGCKDRSVCPHGKHRSGCKECSACPHGKLKRSCKECSACRHGNLKSAQLQGVLGVPARQA